MKIQVHGSAASEHHGPFVSIGANPTIEGQDFLATSLFLSPDSARTLAIDILKAADKADGGQGWQQRLSDALAVKFEATATKPTE